MKFDFYSETGKSFNEDIVYIDNNIAIVLDASTGLTDSKITDFASDGQWFVYEWCEYLKKELPNIDKNISDIVSEGILKIRDKFYQIAGKEITDKLARPSASLSILRVLGDKKLEYFMLGDCSLIYSTDDLTNIIKDRAVEKLDKIAITEVARFRKDLGYTFEEAKNEVLEILIKNRKLKNELGGYFVLEFEEVAVKHSITGILDDIQKIAIMSDGYSAIFDTYNKMNEAELLNELSEKGAKEIYTEIRKIEDKDNLMLDYPRLKKGDDATVAFYNFSK